MVNPLRLCVFVREEAEALHHVPRDLPQQCGPLLLLPFLEQRLIIPPFVRVLPRIVHHDIERIVCPVGIIRHRIRDAILEAVHDVDRTILVDVVVLVDLFDLLAFLPGLFDQLFGVVVLRHVFWCHKRPPILEDLHRHLLVRRLVSGQEGDPKASCAELLLHLVLLAQTIWEVFYVEGRHQHLHALGSVVDAQPAGERLEDAKEVLGQCMSRKIFSQPTLKLPPVAPSMLDAQNGAELEALAQCRVVRRRMHPVRQPCLAGA
mmetsp:Transcript_34921/g.94622  ORF Transcript_34921/g.94622 Transcript_34921/m.94622 type:complete len:262 (-) Transcript_34921:3-788(-)